MFEADVILFVLDATVGATDADEDVVRVLRRTKKPVILVANKVDDARSDADAATLWSLGLGEPFAVSSLHGRGSGELLDAVVAAFPDEGSRTAAPRGPRRVALLGKPNVGQVQPAQPARGRDPRRRRLGRRDDGRPGRRARRDRAASPGVSSTRPGSVGG